MQGPGLACLEVSQGCDSGVYLKAAADLIEPDYQTSFGGWVVGQPSMADFALIDLVGGPAAASNVDVHRLTAAGCS